GTVNRQDDEALSLMAEASKIGGQTDLLRALKRLVDRGVLVQRGANDRLVEVKPDVLRDHLLRKWLLVNVGFGAQPWQPNEDARELINAVVESVKMCSVGPLERAIL